MDALALHHSLPFRCWCCSGCRMRIVEVPMADVADKQMPDGQTLQPLQASTSSERTAAAASRVAGSYITLLANQAIVMAIWQSPGTYVQYHYLF